MWTAVEKGDVKKLAELIRQDPGFRVDMTLLGLNSWFSSMRMGWK